MSDPYDCTLPTGWTARVDGDTVTYTNPAATRRVTITEFSQGLSLFWWIDAVRRSDPDADWTRVATDAGESFRDADRAVRAVESVVSRVAAHEKADDGPADGGAVRDGAVADDRREPSHEVGDEAVADGG